VGHALKKIHAKLGRAYSLPLGNTPHGTENIAGGGILDYITADPQPNSFQEELRFFVHSKKNCLDRRGTTRQFLKNSSGVRCCQRIQQQYGAIGSDNSCNIGVKRPTFAHNADVWFLFQKTDQRFAQQTVFSYEVHILNGDGVD
jgi:hypothetical protein